MKEPCNCMRERTRPQARLRLEKLWQSVHNLDGGGGGGEGCFEALATGVGVDKAPNLVGGQETSFLVTRRGMNQCFV